MALSGCRIRPRRYAPDALHRLLAIATALVAASACSGRAAAPEAGTAPAIAIAEPDAAAIGVELPPGPARAILLDDCLGCHNLGGLTLFAGFYTREDWHALLVTMQSHGASIGTAEIEAVADYLALHFGRDG